MATYLNTCNLQTADKILFLEWGKVFEARGWVIMIEVFKRNEKLTIATDQPLL